MQEKGYVILLAAMSLCVALLFCSCVKDLPDDGELNVGGRETLFAPAETTETEKITETTSPVTETTAPKDETTSPGTETSAPETTEAPETENPVFTGGFSGLY